MNEEFERKVDRDVYPRPEYRYPNARIGLTAADSVPDYPAPLDAPAGAPNVLLVLLDDVGFGWPSVFGGLIRMPTAERLARTGLTYNQFHTTALCSPTRASLLTGRNHHTVHSGLVTAYATGYPGYDGIIPRSCAMITEILRQNGYATGWFGKNHNIPDHHTSDAGPFDNWPTHQGFDYFYGFLGGETNQFYPALYRGTQSVLPPYAPEDGYHLNCDLADDCIGWIRRQKAIAPGRPFFAHFATGSPHAPHQPPLDWRGRNAGRFDMGWDEYRRIVHEQQLESGVIPPGTRLTPRPAEIPAWDDHTPEEQRLFARFAENYADFLEHTDYEIGRVVDALEALGELDNTLVVYIIGDNGSSAEGTLTGTLNELMSLNGFTPEVAKILPRIDEIGLPGTTPHYPVGWAWAGDTPFQWMKQIASHFGGTRNGTIISWPARITDHGGLREQFHHVIDIAPTILEVAGIAEPSIVNGVQQTPMAGVSMAYTFADADAATRHLTQYFEIRGHRALYHDGWIASCRHRVVPWFAVQTADFADDVWELYNIADDFSQAVDLAAAHPEKLADLRDRFLVEAAKYNVLPLDDRAVARLDVATRPGHFIGRERVVLYPGMSIPEGSAPKTHNIDHTISVDVEIPAGGAEGVLVCLGGDSAGWSLFVDGGKLVYHYNWFDTERYEIVSAKPMSSGRAAIRCAFENEDDRPGGPATVRLYVDGELVGEGRLARQVRGRFGHESLDVGFDAASPVSRSYADRLPFAFNGTIDLVRFEFGEGAELSPAEKLSLKLALD